MKTIKKSVAMVLVALMVLTSTVVFAWEVTPGMTLTQFKAEIAPRMTNFYSKATPEQLAILKTFGDSVKTSSLVPYTTVDSAWDGIVSSLMNETFVAQYASAAEAKAVLAKGIYSAVELLFYNNNDGSTTAAQKLDAAIDNAYNNLYLPMDQLAGSQFTSSDLVNVLTNIKNTLSTNVGTYANSIIDAMSASTSATYANTIANSIASVAISDMFTNATGNLLTVKNNFAANAGYTATTLGSLVSKIYATTALIDSTQKAPSVQFNLMINKEITFQGAVKDSATIIDFTQATTLNSATESEVVFAINPNRTLNGIDLNMTNYFVVSSPNNSIISATKIEDTQFGGWYIKLKALPNVVNNGTYYVNVCRKSAADENYFFNIKVDVVGTGVQNTNVTGTVGILSGANATKISIVAKQAGVAVKTVSALANGTFTIDLAPGVYTFEVGRTGYLKKIFTNVTVSAGGPQALSASTISLVAGDVVSSFGTINLSDLQTILNNYGLTSASGSFNTNYDLNDDGKINLVDLQAILNNYGKVQ